MGMLITEANGQRLEHIDREFRALNKRIRGNTISDEQKARFDELCKMLNTVLNENQKV